MAFWDRFFVGDSMSPPPAVGGTALAGVQQRFSLLTAFTEKLDSITNSMTGLGGAVDKGAAARPDVARLCLQVNELTSLYRHNGYVRRFVDIIPDHGTRNGFSLNADTPGETRVEDVNLLGDEFERLGTMAAFAEASIWGRLYGGALVMPVLDETVPPEFAGRQAEWLRQPLRPDLVNRVVSLVVLDRREAQPFDYDGDLRSRNFRRPLHWSITPLGATAGVLQAATVHYSRVIYFPGAVLPPSMRYQNGGFDDSIIEAVWDQIRNKTTVDQSLAVLAQEIKTNVIRIEGLKGLKAGDQAAAFDARMAKLSQGLGLLNMVLLAEGETFEQRHASLAGVKDLDAQTQTAMQAVTGLAGTVLFGGSPAGLSSDDASGTTNLEKGVNAWQERNLKPQIEQLADLLFAQRDGPTKGVKPPKTKVVFAPLNEPTVKQRVEAEKLQAETDKIRIETGMLSADHIAKSRYSQTEYQWDLMPASAAELSDIDDDGDEGGRAALLAAAELDEPGALPSEGRGDALTARYSRRDAVGKLAVLIILSESGRASWALARAEARRLFGEDLGEVELPHVTALYIGEIDTVRIPEASGIIGSITAGASPFTMRGEGLGLFERSRVSDGWPVLIKFQDWEIRGLHDDLLAGLAHLITARQFPGFRPHSTLGTLTREPTADERAALLESPVGRFDLAVAEVVLLDAGQPVARFPLGGDPVAPDPAPEE